MWLKIIKSGWIYTCTIILWYLAFVVPIWLCFMCLWWDAMHESEPKFHEYQSLVEIDGSSGASMNIFEVSHLIQLRLFSCTFASCWSPRCVFSHSGLWRAMPRRWRLARVTWACGTRAGPPHFTTPPPKDTSESSASSYSSPAHRVRY